MRPKEILIFGGFCLLTCGAMALLYWDSKANAKPNPSPAEQSTAVNVYALESDSAELRAEKCHMGFHSVDSKGRRDWKVYVGMDVPISECKKDNIGKKYRMKIERNK